jgi:hypothetical protein
MMPTSRRILTLSLLLVLVSSPSHLAHTRGVAALHAAKIDRDAQIAGAPTATSTPLAPLLARRAGLRPASSPAPLAAAQAAQAARTADRTSRTRAHVETLASEKFGGRQAGTPGAHLAAEYIAAQLARIGARPLPGDADMFHEFEFTAGTRDAGSRISLAAASDSTPTTFTGEQNVRALSFSETGEVNGAVVFAGYGLVIPDSQGFSYDSYAGLDVRDRIVVVLRYFPEDADQKTRALLARYADLRYKALAARERGARALVVVTGPRSPNAGETVPMAFDAALAGSGIVAVSIGGDAARALFAAAGRDLADVQKSLDSANPHVTGFDLPGVTMTVRAAVHRETQIGRNVVAYLPATTPMNRVDKPWIVIGAHYDHLGRGEHGNSLAGRDEAGRIHPGADDNASGSAAVLALAESLAGEPRQRHLLFAFWSAEEIGLIGSNAFVGSSPVPIEQIAAYLNFDMVGRMIDNRLTVQATGSSPIWPRVLEQANVLAGFDLVLQPDPYQPTDLASFNAAGVPSLGFFTNTHADYHRPSDTADKINYEDLDRIVDFARAIVLRLDGAEESPLFTKVERQAPGAGRSGIRVFTGTIPDYATEVEGLLLGGVVAGGPAERAGLQKGDVIVEFAGLRIANIYDYTYALESLKIGEPVTVVYLRNGQKRETTLTPEARK